MYGDSFVFLINKTLGRINLGTLNNSFKVPKKVLIILPNFVGDVVFLIPFIRNLKYNFGEKQIIDVICHKNISNLLETLPYIDNIYSEKQTLNEKLSFLKNKKYDTIFLFNFAFIWGCLSYISNIKQRIGFDSKRMGFDNIFFWQKLITHQIPYTSIKDSKHQLKIYLNTLKTLGMRIFDEYFEVRFTDNDFLVARKLLKNINGLKFLLNIKAGSPGKEWPLKNWIEVLHHLKNNFDCTIIASGTPAEKSAYDTLAKKSGIEIVNLCGKTTIRETIALYKHLDLVITLDTAPAHFAAAANTPNILVIYGPTNNLQWAPKSGSSNIYQVYLNLPCRPCVTRICSHRNCINKLTPKMVTDTIDSMNHLHF